MEISLIFPPSLKEYDECFLMPSLALATLAKCLKDSGHKVNILDYNIFFHKLVTTSSSSSVDFGILTEKNSTSDYLKHGKNAALFAKIEAAFFGWQKIGNSGLYGIGLTPLSLYETASSDFKNNNLFVVNSAALIANRIKKQFSGPVVIGSDELPKPAFHAILSKYSCFDFAVYGSGEAALLKLADHLSGKTVRLSHVLEKTTRSILDHRGDVGPVAKSSADYSSYPLKNYCVTTDALLYRYDPSAKKFLNKKKAEPQLVVRYQFDNSCRGKCTFCPDGDLPFKSSNTVDQTFEDLCRLKELGATGIYFINTNFNNTYKFADELCDKMIKARLNLLWCDCANFRELDEQLLLKMKKAGAIKLTFGLETGSRRLLRLIRKGITTDLAEKHLRFSNSLGIWNAIELIAGLPSETTSDIEETTAFLKNISPLIDSYSLARFQLFTQSPFGRKPAEFGIRPHDDNLKNIDYLTHGALRHCTRKFDEINGPAWLEKEKQIYTSEKVIGKELCLKSDLNDTPQHVYHIHMLMFLYRAFGYSNKKLIGTLFRYVTKQYKPYHTDDFFPWAAGACGQQRTARRKPQ